MLNPVSIDALREAKALYDEGILDEAEFKQQKQELLRPSARIDAPLGSLRAMQDEKNPQLDMVLLDSVCQVSC